MNDNLKLLSFVGILITMLFGWTWNSINRVEEQQQRLWSVAQQYEYRIGVQKQIDILKEELERLRIECRASSWPDIRTGRKNAPKAIEAKR